MKKTLAMLLALTMIFALVACGAPAAPAEAPAAAPAQAPAAAPAEAPAVEPVVLKVNMSESATDNKAIAIDQVVAAIEERTEGRIKFEVYHNGELGTFQDDVEAIVAGGNIVDGTSSSAFADYGCPNMMGMDLMRAFQTPEEVSAFNSSDLFKEMTAQLKEASGIKMMCMNWAGQPRCVMSREPINTLADLDGKIIRTPLANYVAFFTRLGATTASMTMGDTYTALQQGTVDACEFPLGTLYLNSMYEVAKYIYLSEHTYAATCWVMNADIFNGLSAEDQAVVIEEFQKGGDYFTQLNLDTLADFRAKLEAEGVTFVEPSAEDIELMAATAIDSAKDFPDMDPDFMDRLAATVGRK